jgi:hypothetical protein
MAIVNFITKDGVASGVAFLRSEIWETDGKEYQVISYLWTVERTGFVLAQRIKSPSKATSTRRYALYCKRDGMEYWIILWRGSEKSQFKGEIERLGYGRDDTFPANKLLVCKWLDKVWGMTCS